MIVDIKDCDLNEDYFHFTNVKNVNSILNNGLIPQVGAASKLVNDRPNVSVSKGGKGVMGIINSFIYKFTELKPTEIPEEYKKYFSDINLKKDTLISKEDAYKAMERKLKEEVYFRVKISEEEIKKAQIGGLTGYDVNLHISIDKSKLDIITDSNNNILSAYDIAKHIYEIAKEIETFRSMHEDFFNMFEMEEKDLKKEEINDYER